MKRPMILIVTLLALSFTAFAQDKNSIPTATPALKPLAPKPLTEAQVLQIANAQRELTLADTEVALAQQRVATLKAQIDSLAKTFFIDNGLDGQSYQPIIQLIDAKTNVIGFLPKPETPKPPAEKPDVARPDQQKK